jgi:hypothetical protein
MEICLAGRPQADRYGVASRLSTAPPTLREHHGSQWPLAGLLIDRPTGRFGPKASMADFVVSAIHAAPTQGGF